ncbi:MAG: NUDIX domain-containing protein [Parachlamydiales bacterium]
MTLRHQTHLAAYLLLKKWGQLLLGLRQNTGYRDGYYGLPAGHVERGESVLEALLRETRGEVGIEVARPQLVHVCHRSDQKEYLNLIFTASASRGELTNGQPHKCAGWAFFEEHALPPNLIPALGQGTPYSEAGWS